MLMNHNLKFSKSAKRASNEKLKEIRELLQKSVTRYAKEIRDTDTMTEHGKATVESLESLMETTLSRIARIDTELAVRGR